MQQSDTIVNGVRELVLPLAKFADYPVWGWGETPEQRQLYDLVRCRIYATDSNGKRWYRYPIEIPRKHFDIFLFEANEHGEVYQVTEARLKQLRKATK